jgi:hypothetical protein
VAGRDAIAGVSVGVMGCTTPVEFVGSPSAIVGPRKSTKSRGSAKLLKEECHLCELYFLNQAQGLTPLNKRNQCNPPGLRVGQLDPA